MPSAMNSANARTAASQQLDARTNRALAGQSIYGDDFNQAEIENWFADEREGYFNLYFRDAPTAAGEDDPYTYSSLADLHGFRWLPQRQYEHALGVGSANGAELRPVLDRSARITVLEPSEGFATTEIDGKPVVYVKPEPSGLMPFANESFDFIVCFSVLHHIPNVSTVIHEMARVLKLGGHVLLREPTHSMGDWRHPRRGLTKHERGIPIEIFRSVLRNSGLRVLKETRCMFSLTPRVEPLIGRPVWTVPWIVEADAWLCRLPLWSDRYHAVKVWHRFRPTGVAYVLEKPAT
jgi:SAM-dependent methyltransferase